jgi:hypothetical protein
VNDALTAVIIVRRVKLKFGAAISCYSFRAIEEKVIAD